MLSPVKIETANGFSQGVPAYSESPTSPVYDATTGNYYQHTQQQQQYSPTDAYGAASGSSVGEDADMDMEIFGLSSGSPPTLNTAVSGGGGMDRCECHGSKEARDMQNSIDGLLRFHSLGSKSASNARTSPDCGVLGRIVELDRVLQ